MPKEMPDAIDAARHERLKNLAEKKDESIDDENAVRLDFVENFASGIWSDSIKNTRTIERRNRNEIKNHETEIDKYYLGDKKIAKTGKIKENTGKIADEKGDESDEKIRERTGSRDEGHAPLVPFEIAEVDWDGFGTTKNGSI